MTHKWCGFRAFSVGYSGERVIAASRAQVQSCCTFSTPSRAKAAFPVDFSFCHLDVVLPVQANADKEQQIALPVVVRNSERVQSDFRQPGIRSTLSRRLGPTTSRAASPFGKTTMNDYASVASRFVPATRRVALAALVAVGALGASVGSPALAQQATAMAPAPAATSGTLDDKQTATLKEVSKYFNDLKHMKGAFNQTNADGKKMRGKFFIKQPGKFRFDYGSGSKMIIVSDGKNLSVQDLDLKTDSSWELDRTPFRLLLRKDVDLIRDAAVLEVQDVDDLIIVSVQDKSPETPGRIKLFLGKKPALELKEWVTTDAQGIDTRIEIAELNRTEDIAGELFTPQSPVMQKIQQSP